MYARHVRSRVVECGKNLKVNHKMTGVGGDTHLGDNVSFNGMRIQGRGKVVIGDNFHSGIECLMITQIHNYDHGKAIPYDDTCILKDIIIEDNVWLGSRVIVLGGVRIGEGAIIPTIPAILNAVYDATGVRIFELPLTGERVHAALKAQKVEK